MTATGQHDTKREDERSKAERWERVRNMSDEEVVARAKADPEARPLSDEEFARMKPRPRVFIIRRAFRMSQEEFSDAFHIPVETIRDWEEQKSEPTVLEQAYLQVIATNKESVLRALTPVSGEEAAE